jgi:hypothetical protein
VSEQRQQQCSPGFAFFAGLIGVGSPTAAFRFLTTFRNEPLKLNEKSFENSRSWLMVDGIATNNIAESSYICFLLAEWN